MPHVPQVPIANPAALDQINPYALAGLCVMVLALGVYHVWHWYKERDNV